MKKQIKRPLLVFAAGLVLVAASSVGATRAAITYSEMAKEVDFSTAKMTVSAEEYRDDKYVKIDEGLLEFPSLKNEDGKYDFNIGKEYDENVRIVNHSPGKYDEYVRVTLKKSWLSGEGIDTSLKPSLINVDVAKGWIVDDVTEESATYYYTKPLSYSETEGVPFIEHISIDNKVWDYVKTVQSDSDKRVLTNEYRYNDESILVEVKVDGVQAHNGKEAILGAWGVNAEFNGNEIVSVNGSTTKTE